MNQRALIPVALLLAVALGGCARAVWTHPTKTATDFESDRSACRFDVSRAADPAFAAMHLGDCMRGKGWRQVRQEEDAGPAYVHEPVACPGTTYWNGMGCTSR